MTLIVNIIVLTYSNVVNNPVNEIVLRVLRDEETRALSLS